MEKTTFKIRYRVIQAFLFCVLAILVFAGLSFQAHWEIGRRLKLVERADDLINNILEIRRFEKNFFLYQNPASLAEARLYLSRVEEICTAQRQEILRGDLGGQRVKFQRTLKQYRELLSQLEARLKGTEAKLEPRDIAPLEESLRNLGQDLMGIADSWAKEERAAIDHLFHRAMYLFFSSILVFIVLGVLVAFYVSRLLVRPFFEMQQYMERIAHGDFSPIPETGSRSEEFRSLFKALNRTTRELEKHQEQLIQSEKIAAVGTLTSGIAHELNNPINNIVLTAEALKEDFGQLDQEEALGLIQDIIAQSERASEIVKNLLDFSRSERPEFEPVAIAQVIRDTLKLVRNQVVLAGVEVNQDLPPDLPPVRGDVKNLQQVFLNLFINAVQAMKNGGVLTIRAFTADGGDWLKVEVADTGEGINPEDLPHIFEPFFTTKEVGRGTGLGLSVTYGIVRKHGGQISVESEKGQGTRFTAVFPVDRGD